jgi:ribosome-associated protein
VTLLFDVDGSQLLSAEQKAMIRRKLSTRISGDGILSVVSQKGRTQAANKALVIERFYELLQKALVKPKKRVPTRMSKAQKQRLAERKRHHSEKKARRRKNWD